MLTCPSDNGKRISCIESATTRINDSATNLMSFLFYNRNVSVQDSKHSIHWLCAVFLKLKLMRWLDELIIMLDLCCWPYISFALLQACTLWLVMMTPRTGKRNWLLSNMSSPERKAPSLWVLRYPSWHTFTLTSTAAPLELCTCFFFIDLG